MTCGSAAQFHCSFSLAPFTLYPTHSVLLPLALPHSFPPLLFTYEKTNLNTMPLAMSFLSIILLATTASAAGNNALNVNTNTQNGKHVDIGITVQGSDFYYAVMSVMGVVGLACIGCAAAKPRSDRIFFYITAAVNLTACVAYFSMGSNLGWTPIDVEFVRSDHTVSGINREIFYVRYIDWYVQTLNKWDE